MSDRGPSIDPDALAAIRDLQDPGEPDLLTELIDLFQAQSRQGLQAIRAALAEDRLPDVALKAHELKSSSASLGAMVVSTLLARTEDAADAGDRDATEALAAELERALSRALAELSTHREDD